MNKEPIGLYIFRYIMGLAIFTLMLMLYWSSVLIEDDIRGVQTQLASLKNDLFNLRADVVKIKEDVLQTVISEQREQLNSQVHNPKDTSERKSSPTFSTLNKRSHIDPSLENLLAEDPFYTTTLPKLLGPNFIAKGTFHDATIGKYANLHPFSNWAEVANWHSLCSIAVANNVFGKYETLTSDMALKMEARKRKDRNAEEYWIHLRDGVFWQPLNPQQLDNIRLAPQFLRKHPVTAHDFKFYYDVIMNPHVQDQGAVALRNYFDGIEEIEVIDDLTFVVRWQTKKVQSADDQALERPKYMAKLMTGALRPLASFVYQYFPDGKKIVEDDSDPNTYRQNSVWAQNFSQHWAKNIIVSCGPWTFDSRTDREIRFVRNNDYYAPLAVLAEKMIVSFKEGADTVWQDFKANRLDTYAIQPDQLLELKNFLQSPEYRRQENQGQRVNRLDYVGRRYSYVGWNQNNALFKSAKVRQALTMAIDRQRIIKQNLNDMGIELTGPLFPLSEDYDQNIKAYPFDPLLARRILEGEGWYDSNGDGILDREVQGQSIPFRFKLTYFVKNQLSKNIAEYIATAFKEIGILCELNGVDLADLSATVDDKSFDAILLAWSFGAPPEELRQLWGSAGAKEKGSSNIVGFSNAEVDQICDDLDYEYDRQKRTALYHRFHHIIHEEQPYTFLYVPKTALLYRDYVQNVFIPKDRQDLIPGANVAEPVSSIFWLKQEN